MKGPFHDSYEVGVASLTQIHMPVRVVVEVRARTCFEITAYSSDRVSGSGGAFVGVRMFAEDEISEWTYCLYGGYIIL